MITVHHLENSRSHRVLWLLEELAVPYQIKRYQRENTLLAPDELKKVHPLGKSPVITDGNRVIAESGAILEYLQLKYDSEHLLALHEEEEQIQARYWLHYAEGSLMPLLVMKLVLSKVPERVPFLIRPIARAIVGGVGTGFLEPNLATHLAFIDAELARSPWLAGDALTGADVMMSFPLEAVLARAGGDRFPRIAAYVKKIEARPAYQRALKRGGPFELLK